MNSHHNHYYVYQNMAVILNQNMDEVTIAKKIMNHTLIELTFRQAQPLNLVVLSTTLELMSLSEEVGGNIAHQWPQ